ncbi:MAG: hypothetical protein ACYTGH_13660 [Planctomycetota bacterium]|jgi:hypothetical protein
MKVAKIVLRLLVTAGIAIAYLQLPTLVPTATLAPHLDVDLANLERLEVMAAGKTVTATRTRKGEWRSGKSGTLAADADRIQAFLAGLAQASCERAKVRISKLSPRIILTDRAGKSVEIALGKRKQVFRSQYVRIGRSTYLVQEDLASALGLWSLKGVPDRYALLDRALFQLPGTVIKVKSTTPFATYRAKRSDDILKVMAEGHKDQEEVVYRWSATANGKTAKANTTQLHFWHRGANALEIETVTSSKLWQKSPPLYALRLATDTDHEIHLEASGTINEEGNHLVRLKDHRNTATIRIGTNSFKRLFVAGSGVVMNLPRLSLTMNDAVEITAERDGHRFRLTRETPEVEWALSEPQVEYAIFTPKAEPGMEAVSMAEGFAQGLAGFRGREMFVPSAKTRTLTDKAFTTVAAKTTIRFKDGSSQTLTLSQVVKGTGLRFLKAKNQTLVVSTPPHRLVPEIKTFFDPEEVGDEKIDW